MPATYPVKQGTTWKVKSFKNHVRAHFHVDFDNEPINKDAFEIGNVQINLILILKIDLSFWIQSKQYDYGLFGRMKFLYTNLSVFLPTANWSVFYSYSHFSFKRCLLTWMFYSDRLTRNQFSVPDLKNKRQETQVLCSSTKLPWEILHHCLLEHLLLFPLFSKQHGETSETIKNQSSWPTHKIKL